MVISRADRALVSDAWGDLVLGSACVGCDAPGRVLCPACATSLRDAEPRAAWPTPVPPGLVEPWAVGCYADLLRTMVLAHKERQVVALCRPLGALLAVAVRAATETVDTRTPLLLVPVPSRSSVIRQRGYDPVGRMVAAAVARLRRDGRVAHLLPLLRSRPGVADQAGLDARQRNANLTGSMACLSHRLRRFESREGHVVVCDDIVTTGATAREAQRALEASGVAVHAIAVVAATQRRRAALSMARAPA